MSNIYLKHKLSLQFHRTLQPRCVHDLPRIGTSMLQRICSVYEVILLLLKYSLRRNMYMVIKVIKYFKHYEIYSACLMVLQPDMIDYSNVIIGKTSLVRHRESNWR